MHLSVPQVHLKAQMKLLCGVVSNIKDTITVVETVVITEEEVPTVIEVVVIFKTPEEEVVIIKTTKIPMEPEAEVFTSKIHKVQAEDLIGVETNIIINVDNIIPTVLMW